MKERINQLYQEAFQLKKRHSRGLMILMIFLVIPIVTGIGLGYEMKANRIEHIPTVILDQDNTEFSRMLTDYVKENDIFQIVRYADTDREIDEMIQDGEAMVGLIIPKGLSEDMRSGHAPKFMVFYDGSQMSVAGAAKAAMSEILLTVKAGYMQQIYEGKLDIPADQALKMVQPIEPVYRTLYNPAKNYRNFLLPGMLAALVQVGIGIVGLERSQEERCGFTRAVRKIVGWGSLGALAMFICLGIQYVFFGLPYRGSLTGGILLTLLFSITMTGFGFVMGRIIKDRIFATQVTCVLILPTSILGGYTYPLMAMPPFFQTLGKFLPFTYYSDAVRALCMKELPFSYLISDMGVMLGFIAFELLVLAVILYMERHYELAIA